VLLGEGKKVPEVVKTLGVHEVTYYRWRKEYGGLQVSPAKRLKDLERENARLRRAVSDLNRGIADLWQVPILPMLPSAPNMELDCFSRLREAVSHIRRVAAHG